MSILVKGCDQLQDGLYAIHDGIIHKYKAKGGTVRPYKIESIDLVRCGEDVDITDEVTAWMPLPEPWKYEEQTERSE